MPARVTTPQPQTPPTAVEKNQEQIIRQQLLAKQKQLLELQQKKIELELEQTKAQLVSNIFEHILFQVWLNDTTTVTTIFLYFIKNCMRKLSREITQ